MKLNILFCLGMWIYAGQWVLQQKCHPTDLRHKSHNAPVPFPIMHNFVTVHIPVTKWCTVGYLSNELWDLRGGSIIHTLLSCFTGTMPIDILPRCPQCTLEYKGKTDRYNTTIKTCKARSMCIFHRTHCTEVWPWRDDVIKWKQFLRHWSFVRGIHRSPMDSPHRGHQRRALMISLICVWTNVWANTRDAGDLRHHRTHYDVIVMSH